MDCKTARMLFECRRPQAGDLDGAERAELEQHLAHCLECEELARTQRQVDQHLGRAMRAVEVPDRLRAKLLKRLADERGNWYRRWARQAAKVGIAAAAALLLISFGLRTWHERSAPTVDADDAFSLANHVSEAPPQREELQAYFRGLGVDVVLPRNLKYELLTARGLGDFKGRQVPQLVFVDRDDSGNVLKMAQVYLLTRRQFNLRSLPPLPQSRTEEGYTFKVRLVPSMTDGERQACLIFYTGDNWKWLWLEDRTSDPL
jgi:hypothetical protein